MTLISSFMRGAARHTSLVNIVCCALSIHRVQALTAKMQGTIRMLMSIGGLVPLPSDALVTPVTFRVKKRQLRGILAELDSQEIGSRELSGEWVVGKKTWQRLQSEWKAAHSTQHDAQSNEPPKTPSKVKKKERVILYIHGGEFGNFLMELFIIKTVQIGAYYLSSAAAQRLISIPLSKYTDARVFG